MKCAVCGYEIKQDKFEREALNYSQNITHMQIAHMECPSPWFRIRELERELKDLKTTIRENTGFYVENPEVIVHHPADHTTG